MVPEASSRRINFDPTINLGHILTTLTFLTVGVGGWVALDSRVSVLERDQRAEKVERRDHDAGIEARFMREMTLQRSQMDQTQLRVADDIREIKQLMRDVFRDLDGKLDRKTDKQAR